MRKLCIPSLVLAAAAVLALAATALGARSTAAAPAAIPGCAPGSLNLIEDGVLTIGADNPAFPPWFGGDEGPSLQGLRPVQRQGLRVRRRVRGRPAARLREVRTVKWSVVPFTKSFRPGQEAVRLLHHPGLVQPRPREGRRFLESYYFVNQAVVGRKGKPIAKARSVAGLKPFKLGAQLGTTSYSYIVDRIKPSSSPLVYDTNDAAVQALKNGQIDGIVVDLPTAFYVTAVQVPDGVIVGKLPTFGSKERFGMVFQKGNPLRRASTRRSTGSGGTGRSRSSRAWLARRPARPS